MNNCPFIKRPCPECSLYNPVSDFPCTIDREIFESQLGERYHYNGSMPWLSRSTTEVLDNEVLELIADIEVPLD